MLWSSLQHCSGVIASVIWMRRIRKRHFNEDSFKKSYSDPGADPGPAGRGSQTKQPTWMKKLVTKHRAQDTEKKTKASSGT
jgi:hypothetical protein